MPPAGAEVLLDGCTPLGAWVSLRESAQEFETVWQEVEEKQGQSLSAKRRLADETKAFKRLPDEERLVSAPELLKAYQMEIDALSKRAKFGEAAFEALLKRLREAPQSAAVQAQLSEAISDAAREGSLEASAVGESAALAEARAAADAAMATVSQLEDSVCEKDAKIVRLVAESQDLETELKAVTNQAATVRRLERKVREMEVFAEDSAAEVRRQKDEEWGRILAEARQELQSRKEQHEEVVAQLARQKSDQVDDLERLRGQHLEERRRHEEVMLARSLEVDTLTNDLEHLQAELDSERMKQSEPKESAGSAKVLQSLLDGVQRRAESLENEIGDLRRQLSEAADAERKAKQGKEEALRQLQEAEERQAADLSSLREEVVSLRPLADEVEELRRQLRTVERTVGQADVAAAATDVERRLLQKQRALEGELSEAKARSAQAEREAEEARSSLQGAEDANQDHRLLIKRLEAEVASGACSRERLSIIISGSALSAASGGGAALADGASSRSPENASAEAAVAAACRDLTSAESGQAILGSHGTAATAMPSVADILTAQRDRLRSRVADLEQERDRWRASVEEERKRGDLYHADNVKLLEALKYQQSFQPKQGPQRGGRGGARGTKAVDPDIENRYNGAYEDSLVTNPLEKFREDEKAQRYANLSAGERSMVVMGTLLVNSKVARNVTLTYFGAMHMLVLLVLLRLVHGHNHSLT
eukprot:TRINITY_DN21938_c0_g1_i1.p1 TRINITY_DN21938_c0_g1~~TRINITY_DN21938_c0_g1_i1.p1  ORF type:complete len:712 (-),score=208.08 TRINITY_DN21938_c0_g1_i1:178-2313(-)